MYLEWIEKGLQKKGKTKAGLAEALHVHASQVTRLLKPGGRRLRTDELDAIARYLEIPPPGRTEPASFDVQTDSGAHRPLPQFLDASNKIPVYASVEGGPGEMVVTTEAIDWALRPWYLREVKDGYAVVVVGESMVPAYEPGDLAIVNPKAPMIRGKIAIFVRQEHEGDFTATIKKFVRQTPDEWIVEQFNPPDGQPAEFSLPKASWHQAYRVVGKYDGG